MPRDLASPSHGCHQATLARAMRQGSKVRRPSFVEKKKQEAFVCFGFRLSG
jgi:hypothetical protein